MNSNLILYHLGLPYAPDKLALHLDYLLREERLVFDELKNFALVKSNINDFQRARVMDFIRTLPVTFKENLQNVISWRVELSERLAYSIKGDAMRSFQCDVFFISLEAYDL